MNDMVWSILAVTWFLVGLLSFFAICIIEYRGKEYKACDFADCGFVFSISLAFGFLSPVLILIAYFDWGKIKKKLRRFVYNIANIGLKDKRVKGEEHE